MARKIVWNKRAIRNFDEIVRYLEENISETVAAKFVRDVDNLVEKLFKYPEIGRKATKFKTIRQYRIDKYRKMYYRTHGQKLTIVFIFDDRRNPDLNPYK